MLKIKQIMDIEMVEASTHKNSTLAHFAQKVFGIELLLQTVLEKLDKKELLLVRLTNTTWNKKATDILHRRKSIGVGLHFMESVEFHSHRVIEMGSMKEYHQTKLESTLHILEKSLELSLPFPCCNFTLVIYNVYSTQLETFLLKYGSLVQVCFLDLLSKTPPGEEDTWPCLKTIGSLLFPHFTNLKKLILEASEDIIFEQEDDYSEAFSPIFGGKEQKVFPKLEELNIDCSESPSSQVFQRLLEVGINIRKISLSAIQHTNYINVLLQSGKEQLVSFLGLKLNADLLEPVSHLAERHLALKMLNIMIFDYQPLLATEDLMKKASKVIRKILHSTAHSLKHFFGHPFFYYPPFPIPIMPQLEHLHFVAKRCTTVFPSTPFHMSQTFPRLKHVSGSFKMCACISDAVFGERFMGAYYNETVLSVNRIVFPNQPATQCMLNLPKMFPNLVNVRLGLLNNIPEAFGAIWSLTFLKHLHIGVQVLGETEMTANDDKKEILDPCPDLDVALTGIEREVCLQLFHNADGLDLATLDVVRSTKSMLDAKCLRTVCIAIADNFMEQRIHRTRPVLTHISGHFAFKMCPLVRVKLELFARNKGNLELLKETTREVGPFVKEVNVISYSRTSNMPASTCQGQGQPAPILQVQ